MTSEQFTEIERRRRERALAWRRSDGSIADGEYPICTLEHETEETLSSRPAPEPEKRQRKAEG